MQKPIRPYLKRYLRPYLEPEIQNRVKIEPIHKNEITSQLILQILFHDQNFLRFTQDTVREYLEVNITQLYFWEKLLETPINLGWPYVWGFIEIVVAKNNTGFLRAIMDIFRILNRLVNLDSIKNTVILKFEAPTSNRLRLHIDMILPPNPLDATEFKIEVDTSYMTPFDYPSRKLNQEVSTITSTIQDMFDEQSFNITCNQLWLELKSDLPLSLLEVILQYLFICTIRGNKRTGRPRKRFTPKDLEWKHIDSATIVNMEEIIEEQEEQTKKKLKII
jgi:hypothetical protein